MDFPGSSRALGLPPNPGAPGGHLGFLAPPARTAFRIPFIDLRPCSTPTSPAKSAWNPDKRWKLTCPKVQVIVCTNFLGRKTSIAFPLSDSNQREYAVSNLASIFLYARGTPGPACWHFLAARRSLWGTPFECRCGPDSCQHCPGT